MPISHDQLDQPLWRDNAEQAYATFASWQADGAVPDYEGAALLGKEGAEAAVYGVGGLAVRVFRKQERYEARVESLARGLGGPCLEQLVAAGENRTYTHILPGSNYYEIDSDTVAQLEPRHFEDLLDGIEFMEDSDLVVDTGGVSIVVDKSKGFGMYDYHHDDYQAPYDRVEYVLSLMSSGYRAHRMPTPAQRDQEMARRIAPLERFRSVVAQRQAKLPDYWQGDDESSTDVIDATLHRMQRYVQ